MQALLQHISCALVARKKKTRKNMLSADLGNHGPILPRVLALEVRRLRGNSPGESSCAFAEVVQDLVPNFVPSLIPVLMQDVVQDLMHDLVPDLVPNLVPILVHNLVRSEQFKKFKK